MQRGGERPLPLLLPGYGFFILFSSSQQTAPRQTSAAVAGHEGDRGEKKKRKKGGQIDRHRKTKIAGLITKIFFFWKRKKTEAFITGSRRVDRGQVRHGSGQEKKITPVGFDCRIHERPFSGKESVLGIVGEKQKRDVACRNRRGGEGREREREKNREMSPTPR